MGQKSSTTTLPRKGGPTGVARRSSESPRSPAPRLFTERCWHLNSSGDNSSDNLLSATVTSPNSPIARAQCLSRVRRGRWSVGSGTHQDHGQAVTGGSAYLPKYSPCLMNCRSRFFTTSVGGTTASAATTRSIRGVSQVLRGQAVRDGLETSHGLSRITAQVPRRLTAATLKLTGVRNPALAAACSAKRPM